MTVRTARALGGVAGLAFLLLPLQAGGADEKKAAAPHVAKKIDKVDVQVQESKPPNLVVTAYTKVPTLGYTAQLVRVVYLKPPADGIQDYIMFVTPPSGMAAQQITELKASDTWKGYPTHAPWLKGVRVHGVDDGVVVKMLPRGKAK